MKRQIKKMKADIGIVENDYTRLIHIYKPLIINHKRKIKHILNENPLIRYVDFLKENQLQIDTSDYLDKFNSIEPRYIYKDSFYRFKKIATFIYDINANNLPEHLSRGGKWFNSIENISK